MAVHEVTATAPIRIADLGGWTDTWFAGSGVVCNVAVAPGATVRIDVGDGRSGSVVVVAENFGDRYAMADGRGRHPLLEAAIDQVGTPPDRDVVITVASAVPPGASTGTSAAVTVALLGALLSLRAGGGDVDGATVAALAHHVESVRLGRQTGIQDQLAAAHGGINRIDMTAYPVATVTPIPLPPARREELERRLLLVYLGRSHLSSAVHEEVIRSFEEAPPSVVEARLDPLRMAAREGADALLAGDLDRYGRALLANTAAQSALHPSLVGADARRVGEAARAAGATGWKVNGAGGDGGSITILCSADPSSRARTIATVRAAGPAFRPIDTTIDRHGLRVTSRG